MNKWTKGQVDKWKSGQEAEWIRVHHTENSFTVPHPIGQNYLLFVLIQMSGYSDFSYQGSMLENSTKDHHFLVLLIASKDPSKNAYTCSALFWLCLMDFGSHTRFSLIVL